MPRPPKSPAGTLSMRNPSPKPDKRHPAMTSPEALLWHPQEVSSQAIVVFFTSVLERFAIHRMRHDDYMNVTVYRHG